MKKLTILLLALAGMTALSGCVAYPVAYDRPVVYRAGPPPGYRDRDGDGVPNRYDRRPNNPYRY